MIRVTVHKNDDRIAEARIWNDETGTMVRANYCYEIRNGKGDMFKQGRVTGFLRQYYTAFHLAAQVLKEAAGGERRI